MSDKECGHSQSHRPCELLATGEARGHVPVHFAAPTIGNVVIEGKKVSAFFVFCYFFPFFFFFFFPPSIFFLAPIIEAGTAEQGSGIAQWVECPTEKPRAILTRVQPVPVAVRQGIFLLESSSSADSLTVSVPPPPACTRQHQHLCAR